MKTISENRKPLDPQQNILLDQELRLLAAIRPLDSRNFTSDSKISFSVSDDELRSMSRLLNLRMDDKFYSSKPVLGPFIVLAKSCLAKVLRVFLNPFFTNQNTVNQYIWNQSMNIRQMEEKIKALEVRLEKMEAHQHATTNKD